MISALDLLVLLKVGAENRSDWSQREVANELGIAQSSVNLALRAGERVRLYNPERKKIVARNLEEALVHGARYFLAPVYAGEARGLPTSWAAPPLREQIATTDELIPVWPDPNGTSRGIALEPLHKNAPLAAAKDPALYELLALVDALREARPRESQLAAKELHARLRQR